MKEKQLCRSPNQREMWSPYSCFTVTFVGLLFTCLTDWCLYSPPSRCFPAGVIQGWIIQEESFCAFIWTAHSGHLTVNEVRALFSAALNLFVLLSEKTNCATSYFPLARLLLTFPPRPARLIRLPLMSGGEGEPWPDSGHHNEDLGEKERPNQLHWIPTAHGSWRCGRWVYERKKHWDVTVEMVFCDSEIQVCRRCPSNLQFIGVELVYNQCSVPFWLHQLFVMPIYINHGVSVNVLNNPFLQSSWLTGLSRSSRT